MAKKTLQIEPFQILTFPFQDEHWIKKIIITSLMFLFSFIPVVPLVLLLGYAGEIIRGVAVDEEPPALPEWDDLGSYFNSGIRLFGVGLIYLIPSVLFFGIGYLAIMAPVFLTDIGIFLDIEGMVIFAVFYLMGFGLMGVGALVSLLTGLILPVAGAHAAVTSDFQAAFKFKEIWALIKANWGGFVVSFLILLGAAVVLYYGAYFLAATIILCCLYPFAVSFMSAYLLLIGAGFFGNAYRISVLNLPS